MRRIWDEGEFFLNDLSVFRTFLRCRKSYLNDLRIWGVFEIDEGDLFWMIWMSLELSWGIENLIWMIWDCEPHLRWMQFYLNDLNAFRSLWGIENLIQMIFRVSNIWGEWDLVWVIWVSSDFSWGVENLIWMIWNDQIFEVEEILLQWFQCP